MNNDPQPTYDEQISVYLDGELSGADQDRVEKLLKEDDFCRQLYEESCALREALQSLETYKLDADFHQRVLQRIQDVADHSRADALTASAPREQPARKWNWQAVIWPIAALAATILIILFVPDGHFPVQDVAVRWPTPGDDATLGDHFDLQGPQVKSSADPERLAEVVDSGTDNDYAFDPANGRGMDGVQLSVPGKGGASAAAGFADLPEPETPADAFESPKPRVAPPVALDSKEPEKRYAGIATRIAGPIAPPVALAESKMEGVPDSGATTEAAAESLARQPHEADALSVMDLPAQAELVVDVSTQSRAFNESALGAVLTSNNIYYGVASTDETREKVTVTLDKAAPADPRPTRARMAKQAVERGRQIQTDEPFLPAIESQVLVKAPAQNVLGAVEELQNNQTLRLAFRNRRQRVGASQQQAEIVDEQLALQPSKGTNEATDKIEYEEFRRLVNDSNTRYDVSSGSSADGQRRALGRHPFGESGRPADLQRKDNVASKRASVSQSPDEPGQSPVPVLFVLRNPSAPAAGEVLKAEDLASRGQPTSEPSSAIKRAADSDVPPPAQRDSGEEGMVRGGKSLSTARLRIRGTLPWHNFLSGPTAWNEEDYKVYLGRLAELDINFIGFHCYTGGAERYATYVEPLIRITYRDVVPEATLDTSLTARWGFRPLAAQSFAYGTSDLYQLPSKPSAFGADCAVTADNNEQRYRNAQALMSNVLSMAHERGIQVAMGFEFGIHPPEFASVVPPDAHLPGGMLPDPTHSASIEILQATIDDILEVYPSIDYIWLWLHEHTMFVGQRKFSERFRRVYEQHAVHFQATQDEASVFTGVWSLEYIRQAHAYLTRRAPRVKLILGGWGGGTQLPEVLKGLDRALPRDVIFSCLNPGLGTQPHVPALAEIAKNRAVWAAPWLEGDGQLWHLQPRVSLMLDHVGRAHRDGLDGVVTIHWRTEETAVNLEAFAQAASDPGNAPTLEQYYKTDSLRRYGPSSADRLTPLLAEMDRQQWFNSLQSPEYRPYDPQWGRIPEQLRPQLEGATKTVDGVLEETGDAKHKANLQWLSDNLRFTFLLDEVGRQIEPAWDLKNRQLVGEIDDAELPVAAQQAREALDAAPMKALFGTYARRVRSRGELGVLSSMNQKLWLQYRELDDFLSGLEADAQPAQEAVETPMHQDVKQ